MKNDFSLEDRIRTVRRGFRAGQPIDYRIQIVREHHRVAKKKAERANQKTASSGN